MVTDTNPSPFSNTDPVSAPDHWLTGADVLRQTGISKRDLIRFIQFRLIPKSMMRISPIGHGQGRKKSYFSPSLLEQVATWKRLRDQGYTIETIARTFQADPQWVPDATIRQQSEARLPRTPAGQHPFDDAIPPHVELPIAGLDADLFFVHGDLRMGWAKPNPKERLSQAIVHEIRDNPSGTVFDILLRASLKELVFNWQPLFAFVYGFLRQTTSTEVFRRLAPTISIGAIQSDETKRHATEEAGGGRIDSCPILSADADGRERPMRIFGISLAKGTLFLLKPERPADHPMGHFADATTGPGKRSDEAEGKVPFGVLSAHLDNSRGIVETLLPDTYYRLMRRIWEACDRVLTARGGHRTKRSGTDVQYMLPRQTETDPVFDAIRCAVELRDTMREIETDLKANGGWYADIRLNMGISSGKDRLRPDDPTASMAFTLPGGAADQAFSLSAFARKGEIWVTKSAFGHLTARQMRRITFGIYRDARLVPNIFAKLSALAPATDEPAPEGGIASLAITQIIALDPEGYP